MKMTMEQIGRLAGVSAATVSRVINGNNIVSEHKREAVLKVLDDVDIPVRKVPKKRGEAAKVVGVLLLDGIFNEPDTVLEKLDQMVNKLPMEYTFRLLSPQLNSELLKSWYRKGEICALVLLGHGKGNQKLSSAINAIPHVWLNSHVMGCEEPSILSGNESSGRMAARYLFSKKCSKIALFHLESCNPGFEARIQGFRFECFTKNVKYDELKGYLPETKTGFEECSNCELETVMEKYFHDIELKKYDGIFIPESRLLALFHRELSRRKLKKFPKMISCNTASEYFAGLYPRPSYIDFDADMVAQLALEQLQEKMSGNEFSGGRVSVIVNPVLVAGDI